MDGSTVAQSGGRPIGGRLLSTLGLAACCVALLAPSAAAQAPPTLTGETLTGAPGQTTVNCQGNLSAFTITWSVSGVATVPYPGTFTETGRHTSGPGADVIEAEFQIESPLGNVVGTKRFFPPGAASSLACGNPLGTGTFSLMTYEATITTPDGHFADRGRADTFVLTTQPGSGNGTFQETFLSDLGEPLPTQPTRPTDKDQCKDGGYAAFGFRNQGDCVSFVATGGKNEPRKKAR